MTIKKLVMLIVVAFMTGLLIAFVSAPEADECMNVPVDQWEEKGC